MQRLPEGEWYLQHASVVIDEEPDGYAVGFLHAWEDARTGQQAGAYLHMADAPHLERAEEMRDNIYRLADDAGIADHELAEFAQDLIKGRAEWQPLTDDQWHHIDQQLAPDEPDFADDRLRQSLLEDAIGLAREEIGQEPEVLHGLGIQIEDFDPATTPPPLFDDETQTAYWIGVYQPDISNPAEAITSLLSIRADERGQPQAYLAPVAIGDRDHAQRSAEYLLDVAAQTSDVGQMLDAAEGLAVATQNRALWETTQGIPVEDDIAFSPVSMKIE